MNGYGHNSASYGETLRDETETVLGDEHQKLFHYVQWHLSDYLTGTKGLTFEFEGAYMRFLANLYDRGKPFPDDDRFMAVIMATDIRKWRRIRVALIEFGKILVKNGCLTNARFEKERKKRAEEIRKQAEAVKKHWEEKRSRKQIGETSAPTSPGHLPGSPSEVGEIYGKKPNEINETGKAPSQQTRDQRPIRKKDSDPNGSGPIGAESLRDLIWQEGVDWLRSKTLMNEAKLRTRLGGWVKDYGVGPVWAAIASAQESRPVEAMSYIEGILRRPEKSATQPNYFEEKSARHKAFRQLLGAGRG